MRRSLCVVLAGGGSVLWCPPARAQSTVKEEVLGPLLKYVQGHFVAPHGVRLATAVPGDGEAGKVVVDGVEIAAYDRILDGNYVDVSADPELIDVRDLDAARAVQRLRAYQVRFSGDGSRYAFACMIGGDGVVFADGKELWRAKGFDGQLSGLRFSPGGKHVYFILMPKAQGEGYRVVMDGQAQAASYLQPFPVFSPDDSRYAYISTDLQTGQSHSLIIDGKPAAYSGVRPVFDGENRLLTVKVAPETRQETLQIDGAPAFVGSAVQRIFPDPSGARTAASGGLPGKGLQLIIDGKPVVDVAAVDDFKWSADGKHYAAACQGRGHERFVVYDGKTGPQLEAVSDLMFSPDSTTLVYTARHGGQCIVMFDNERATDGVPTIPLKPFFYGPAAKIAWVESKNANDQALVMGDEAIGGLRGITGVTFSRDGSRAAFAFGPADTRSAAVDGEENRNFYIRPFQSGLTGVDAPWFVMSPDGKHIAYFGNSRQEARAMGVVVDGILVRTKGPGVGRVHFTPDSRHILWVEQEKPFQKVYVDGVPAAQFDLGVWRLDDNPGMWEMGPDGVFSIMGSVGEVVKRLRITPDPATSIDTMLAKAKGK